MKSYKDLRVVFFGTPDFAVATLKALLESGLQIVGVVTATDKPAGRGKQIQASAVKEFAVAHGLHVLQPEKMKALSFLEELYSLKPDLNVVVAFRMMPEVVWNMPPMGTFNVHGSLLPQYRGAAPINWAIMNGEKQTGVTTFKLKHEIDTGDIMLTHAIDILPEDNAGSIHDKLMIAGANLMVDTIKGVVEGTIVERKQDDIDPTTLKHAPKIFKEHMQIQWTWSVQKINNHVRGLAPYPAAHTVLAGKNIKVYQVHIEECTPNIPIGEYDTDHSKYIRFAAANGWVYLDEIQQEGKKRMDIASFLRGFRA